MGKATDLRRAIGDVGFDFWVRMAGQSGEKIWVGPNYGTAARCATLMGRLSELGYSPEMNGTTGTSGEWIIEI